MAVEAKQLDEMSAVIVGGTSGIGLATAEALLRAGAPRLRLVGRNAARAEAAVAQLAQDPFVAEGIAEYDPMGFNPSIGELKG